MTYQEQLLDNRWKAKRKQILERDNYECQHCNNLSYSKKYNIGLIFSNQLPVNAAKSQFIKNEKYLTHIWDLKKNKILIAFTDQSEFSTDKSYVALYREGETSAQILGLKMIDNNCIEINSNLLLIIENGIRGKVSSKTYDAVYNVELKERKWDMVLGLHVHHKFYQEGCYAWQYSDNALITLCWECHEELHAHASIPKLDSSGNVVQQLILCSRCAGAGVFPEYNHVQSGVCFKCNGKRFEDFIVS
ncbi:HNH endonuclease [Bizionia paragorgiae]|uniref:Uncharacterized protein n=1 Tax=Bizionia paragorgiae TaxID=283786 RepID=A0A1H3X1D1_BIZPA|nr:hypothetical protein [Bizionia paragorgiae]SDZ92791.1 hypothetical protein SAMN04487990_10489 [Bizionia paragorgiae]